MRAGAWRIRSGWVQILQTAVAAAVAWVVAALVLGQEQPVFASIATVLALGVSVGERGRRALELVFGVAFGFAVANFFVYFLGLGPLQIAGMVALAMCIGVFFGERDLGVNETAISAMILIVSFQPVGASFSPDRLFEALIGCAVALVVNALLPANPEIMVERAAHPIFDDAVAVLEEVAAALDEGDLERTEQALLKAREIDQRVSGFKEALAAGQETARFAPPRRRAMRHLNLYAAASDQIDLTVRNVRGLARAAFDVVRAGAPVPEELSGAVLDLARAVEALAAYLETPGQTEEDARTVALRAVGRATVLLEEHKDLATNVFVGQIRAAVIDLLGATGMSRGETLQAVDEATDHAPPETG